MLLSISQDIYRECSTFTNVGECLTVQSHAYQYQRWIQRDRAERADRQTRKPLLTSCSYHSNTGRKVTHHLPEKVFFYSHLTMYPLIGKCIGILLMGIR